MAGSQSNSGRIGKVLVANRGEIARRIFRTCRRMGIATVAVHSEPDASAPFVAEADEAVPLGGTSAAESYLRVDAIVEAARVTGSDAVHPGYGFLAENAGFARAVLEAGLAWIGPPPEAIEAMGSKLRARALMTDAGVPVVPGAELGVAADGGGDLAAAAEAVGFPIMVKASAGGGGKGMRAVADSDGLERAVEGARREAESSFGDGTVFLERFVERPRHVEIQVFADVHGNTVSLSERECSIQRRHQKVVEESPSPAVGEELRSRMGTAAVRAAEAVGYLGAGTVEFLLSPDDEFFFLEMNTRLQVEHPVTELVTGLDLVRLQILVASGSELPAEAREPRIRGHAIEARLYAEDPAGGYLPQTGTIERLAMPGAERFAVPVAGQPPAAELIRLDSGVEDGSEVPPHYDPMLAKAIAWAPTRTEAAERLAAALADGEVHGLLTNRDFLVRILRHPAFLDGETDTGFLERHEGLTAPLAGPEAERVHAAATALAAMAERRAGARVLGFVPPGWRNNPGEPQRTVLGHRDGEFQVAYRLGRGGELTHLAVGPEGTEEDPEPLPGARLRGCRPGLVDLEAGGVRRRYRVRRSGTVYYVNSALGQSELREVSRLAPSEEAVGEGAVIAPMPGKVVQIRAAEGEEVERGSVVIVLEAMKMEHELPVPFTGTLAELRIRDGQQVESGAVLAVVEPPE